MTDKDKLIQVNFCGPLGNAEKELNIADDDVFLFCHKSENSIQIRVYVLSALG
jgi:hypothetical protein